MNEFDLLTLAVQELTEISKEELTTKKRTRPLVELRSICANILKLHIDRITVKEMGELLNVDHSTISYYTRLHGELMIQKDGKYKALFEDINNLYCLKTNRCSNPTKIELLRKKNHLENMLLDVNLALNKIEELEGKKT